MSLQLVYGPNHSQGPLHKQPCWCSGVSMHKELRSWNNDERKIEWEERCLIGKVRISDQFEINSSLNNSTYRDTRPTGVRISDRSRTRWLKRNTGNEYLIQAWPRRKSGQVRCKLPPLVVMVFMGNCRRAVGQVANDDDRACSGKASARVRWNSAMNGIGVCLPARLPIPFSRSLLRLTLVRTRVLLQRDGSQHPRTCNTAPGIVSN